MEPITTAQSNLKKSLSEFKISYEYYNIDFSIPENWLLVNIITDMNANTEGYRIHINGQDLSNSYFENLFDDLKEERERNLLHVTDFKKKRDYLERMITDLRRVEDNIVEEEIWIHSNTVIENFEISELKDYELKQINDFFFDLKSKLRDEITTLLNIRKDIVESEASTNKSIKKDVVKIRKFVSSSFTFNKPQELLGRLNFLQKELMTFKFIHEKTRETQFRKIFTGEAIDNPVKWIGDKGALVYFIRQLIKREIIKDPGDQKWAITVFCFRDIDGNEFAQGSMRGTHQTASCKYIDAILENL